MKKFTTIIVILSFGIFLNAQNNLGKTDDLGRLAISTYIPDQISGITPEAKNYLETKLNQIVMQNGLGDAGWKSRFIISANVIVLTKDITPTAPPMHAVTLEIHMYIGDGVEGTQFANHTLSIKGVGSNETKAYTEALKNIRPRDGQYKNFIERGKQKIIEYYNSQCDFILKEALSLAEQKQYEYAIYKLLSIPDVCKECYFTAMDQATDIYKLKIANDCQKIVSESKALLAKKHYDDASAMLARISTDYPCFRDAADLQKDILNKQCNDNLARAQAAWTDRNSKLAATYLAIIPADAPCAEDAYILSEEISQQLESNEKRDWDLAYEMYKNEMLYMQNQAYDLELKRIDALKEIGAAFAKSQSEYVYKSIW